MSDPGAAKRSGALSGPPGPSPDAEAAEGSARSLPAGKRRVRRRLNRPLWVRLWQYFKSGPPAELAQSVADLLRPEETFRNTRGPWHRGLVVRPEDGSSEGHLPQGQTLQGHPPQGHTPQGQTPQIRSSRDRSSGDRSSRGSSSRGSSSRGRSSRGSSGRRRGVPRELDGVSAARMRLQVIGLSLGAAATIWWFWPWWRPPEPPVLSNQDSRPVVVGVDGSSFRRIRTALSAWRAMPGARLVVMDLGAIQSYAELRNAAFTPEEMKRVSVISTCGDTLTMSADWASFLRRMPGAPGQMLIVTSPDHLERLTAILQVMLGGDGWRLEGMPSEVAENPPESILRTWRDQLRAQFWRATGFSGKDLFVCKARGAGLI